MVFVILSCCCHCDNIITAPLRLLSNGQLNSITMCPFLGLKHFPWHIGFLIKTDLGTKINQQLQPLFTSKEIADHLRVTEEKPPLINQQSVVYEFICDLCDTNYIGYTCCHPHQRVEEHKHSVIGKHFWDAHGLTPTNLIKNFKVLMKCCSKLDCLIYEMLWIKNKGPKLNTQTDSIRAKLFT